VVPQVQSGLTKKGKETGGKENTMIHTRVKLFGNPGSEGRFQVKEKEELLKRREPKELTGLKSARSRRGGG